MKLKAIGVNPLARASTIVDQMNRPIIGMTVGAAVVASVYESLSDEQQHKAAGLFSSACEGRAMSKEMAHTPGPWRLRTWPEKYPDSNNSERDREYYFIDGGSGVNSIGGLALSGWLSPANAHLIAAAPDLLDALRQMVEGMDSELGRGRVDTSFPLARAAINKATGGAP